MLAFESLTPEALLKELAEFLRMEALKRSVNVTILDRKSRLTRAETLKRAREESAAKALEGAAHDLAGAAILPEHSILRKQCGPRPVRLRDVTPQNQPTGESTHATETE